MNKLTEKQEKDCLNYNPFEGDFGDPGDREFLDKIAVARKSGPCQDCYCEIKPGETIRRKVSLIDGDMRTYRWCFLCCEAMAKSWKDNGEAIDDRFALRVFS
jgi:hypothetical protein